jgi:hypothetical protein
MASFHCEIKSGRKGAACDHADYITRQGYHSRRGDLIDTGHGNLPAWSQNDPKTFWRAADKSERKNGATYREAIIALPGELTLTQNTALLADLVEKIARDKPFQYALHAPISSLEGELNLHGHVMTSDRVDDGIERSAETFFSRYNPRCPEAGGRKKSSGGRNRSELRDEMVALRKTVADTINHHLALNGCEARVDHRSLKEQAVLRQPERHLGPARIRRMSSQEKKAYVARRTGRSAALA